MGAALQRLTEAAAPECSTTAWAMKCWLFEAPGQEDEEGSPRQSGTIKASVYVRNATSARPQYQ